MTDDVGAMLERAHAHHRAGRLAEAAALCDQLLAGGALLPSALTLSGTIAYQTGQAERAAELLRRSVELDAGQPAALHVLALALLQLGDEDGAATSLARAWYAAGCIEKERGEYVDAVASFHKALAIAPDWLEARHNLGAALFELGQVNEAVVEFRRAVAIGGSPMPGAMLAVIIPGSSAADNQAVLDARRSWWAGVPDVGRARERPGRRPVGGGPLRVGYVSSFFHRPNWMKPVWGLINQHDRTVVELHLFSDAPAAAIGAAYAPNATDSYHDIAGRSNDEVAALIERCGIDVLVDLNGYSRLPRLGLFALRPAPVIAGWFNMYATAGMSCFDYLIGDDVVIPPDEERFYVERIVRVPGCYLTFTVDYPVPPVADSPCASEGAVTFGCLASQYKLTGEVIAAWSRILAQARGTRMIIRNGGLSSAGTRSFVHGLFAQHGIAAERVRLEGPAEHGEFLRTYDAIDVALDTFPYNGGTTTTEAIWQGVPVVTFHGDRWVARTSATILRAGTLGEFVARDVEEYVALAVGLATSAAARDRLGALRREMRARLLGSPVCDTRGFARAMEGLYLAMHERRV